MEPAKSSYRAKRPFSQVEAEDDEAVPISKRINHLDINKGQRTSQGQEDKSPPLHANVARVTPHQAAAAGPVTPPSALPRNLGEQPLPAVTMPAPLYLSCFPVVPHADPRQSSALCYGPPPHQQPLAAPVPVLNGGQYHNGSSPGLWSQPAHHQTNGSCPGFWSPPTHLQTTAYPHAAITAGGVHYPSGASPGHGLGQDTEVFDDDEPMNGVDEVYNPELTENDNPHYYQINHLLFQTHCDRARRGGYTVTFGPSGSAE